MAEEKYRDAHVIVMAALAYIRCECGWQFKLEHLRGKTDEDLMIETMGTFEKHKKRKDAK